MSPVLRSITYEQYQQKYLLITNFGDILLTCYLNCTPSEDRHEATWKVTFKVISHVNCNMLGLERNTSITEKNMFKSILPTHTRFWSVPHSKFS